MAFFDYVFAKISNAMLSSQILTFLCGKLIISSMECYVHKLYLLRISFKNSFCTKGIFLYSLTFFIELLTLAGDFKITDVRKCRNA